MIQGFYSGTAGLRAQQTAVDNIANNIANVNTTGFKTKDEEFSSLLSVSMVRPDYADYPTELTGSGTEVSNVKSDMSGGGMVTTDSALDFYPLGSGFFAVRDTAGNTYYTRDGSFSVATSQNGSFLVNAEGMQVLDANANPVAVNANGTPAAQAGLFTFSNSMGLANAGGSLYTQTADSGAAAVSAEGYKTGTLEGSNVDLARQMTRLIVAQRGYQFSSRVVQTADQIAALTNEIKT